MEVEFNSGIIYLTLLIIVVVSPFVFGFESNITFFICFSSAIIAFLLNLYDIRWSN